MVTSCPIGYTGRKEEQMKNYKAIANVAEKISDIISKLQTEINDLTDYAKEVEQELEDKLDEIRNNMESEDIEQDIKEYKKSWDYTYKMDRINTYKSQIEAIESIITYMDGYKF